MQSGQIRKNTIQLVAIGETEFTPDISEPRFPKGKYGKSLRSNREMLKKFWKIML